MFNLEINAYISSGAQYRDIDCCDPETLLVTAIFNKILDDPYKPALDPAYIIAEHSCLLMRLFNEHLLTFLHASYDLLWLTTTTVGSGFLVGFYIKAV